MLGTLWSVNDASTALLMVRFYELMLQDRLPLPVALRQSQVWLRDATNAELDAAGITLDTDPRRSTKTGQEKASSDAIDIPANT